MKLKLDSNGNVVLSEGMPVYVHEDGKEIPFDAPKAFEKIKLLNDESKSHREAKESALKKLEVFGDLDPEAAKKALETVKTYDQKKLVDAGEVDKVKSEAVEAFKKQLEETKQSYDKKINELSNALQAKEGHIFDLMVKNRFSTSPVVKEKLAVPAEMVEATFGKNFKIEDGKVIGYLNDKKIYSRKDAGEYANFDEALEAMIEAFPNKDMILKGSGASGSGSSNSGSRGDGVDFHKLSPTERMNYARNNSQ